MKKGYVIFNYIRGERPSTRHDRIYLITTKKKKAIETLVELNDKFISEGYKTNLVKKHLTLEVYPADMPYVYAEKFYVSRGNLAE